MLLVFLYWNLQNIKEAHPTPTVGPAREVVSVWQMDG